MLKLNLNVWEFAKQAFDLDDDPPFEWKKAPSIDDLKDEPCDGG